MSQGVVFFLLFQQHKVVFVSPEQVAQLLFHHRWVLVDEGWLLLIGCGGIFQCGIVVVENKRCGDRWIVEIETVGKCVDEIDKLAELIRKHEADQHWPLENDVYCFDVNSLLEWLHLESQFKQIP
ncbi:hypothetical protein Tco_0671650 [Tanacetum coccineum]